MGLPVKAFLSAAGRGDAATVLHALRTHERSIMDEDGSRATALHRACAGGHLGLVSPVGQTIYTHAACETLVG
jgi:hypothetical protein